MTWTRLPDDFTDRPVVLRLSRSARLLHIEALVWSNRLLTNGLIPARALARISDSDDLNGDVQELIDAQLWSDSGGESWQVDWSGQETAAVVEQRREHRNARQKKFNDRRQRHARHDHSMCDPRFCPALHNAPRNALRNALRNASDDAPRNAPDDGLPARPDPTRPDRKGGEGWGGEEGGSPTGAGASAALRTDPSVSPGDDDSDDDDISEDERSGQPGIGLADDESDEVARWAAGSPDAPLYVNGVDVTA